MARLKTKWQGEYEAWNTRSVAEVEPVYLWVDGVYVKAGLEKEKAAVLVVLAALQDGRKVILPVTPGYRESQESWAAVLRALRKRGLRPPRLIIGDGHLGIWSALRNGYPEAAEQRCWNHKLINVLDRLPKKARPAATELLRRIPYASTRKEAEQQRGQFRYWCEQHGYEAAAETLERDWEQLVTFYDFPQAHWQHLRTTNPGESPFAAARLRTDAAKRFKRVEKATAVLWKLLLVAESHFRRLKHPELLPDVAQGRQGVNGKFVPTKAAA